MQQINHIIEYFTVVILKLCCNTTAYPESLTLSWMISEVSGGLALADALPSKMMCFCCTARICLWGLQSRGETAIGAPPLCFFLVYFMMGRACPGVVVSIKIFPCSRPGQTNPFHLVSYPELVWSPASLGCVAPWCSLSLAHKAQAGVCDSAWGLGCLAPMQAAAWH